MKKLSKVLSVGLSLVLCGSMIAPAFAASFRDLNNAIGGTYTGSAFDVTENDGVRNITLNENVSYGENQEKDDQSIAISSNTTVTIDLNGYAIDGGNRFNDSWGNLEYGNKGHVVQVGDSANLTVNDSSALNADGEYVAGKGTGKITGGDTISAKGTKTGAGVSVGKNASFTMNGGSITANRSWANGAGVWAGSGSFVTLNGVTVSKNGAVGNGGGIGTDEQVQLILNHANLIDNFATDDGGGVYVGKNSELALTNSAVSGNVSHWAGGISNFGTVNMTGSKISGNTADWGGGVFNGDQFTMWSGEIVENISNGDAGGVYNSGDFVMHDGEISRNTSAFDGGAMYMSGWRNATGSNRASFTMNGGEIADNKAISSEDWGGGGFLTLEDGTTFTMNRGAVVRNYAKGVTEEKTGPNGVLNRGNVIINYDNVIICNYGRDGDVNTVHNPGNPVRENETETSYDLVVYCAECDNELSRRTIQISSTPDDNDPTPTPDRTPNEYYPAGTADPEVEAEDTGIEIEDEAVPLAGLFTRADAIGYLWEQSGSPEAELSDFADVPEDHQWAVAIGWAQDMGIALADEDGNFRPDDLVLRSVESLEISPEGELQEFLNRYAVFAGIELDDGELFIELEGSWDDVIMGEEAQEIFNDFFARLEEALADIAA